MLLCLEGIQTIELPAFLNLEGEKMRKQCLQANLTPQPINQSSMMNSSLEALSFMTRSSRAGKQASTEVSGSVPPDPRNALGIYDGQWITLFLAEPRKWTRSSAPLFHSVLSPAFAAKRKQWRILAPRQAPNKVPVLCSAPRGSERWRALSGQQRAVACDDRPAVTCCPGASHQPLRGEPRTRV